MKKIKEGKRTWHSYGAEDLRMRPISWFMHLMLQLDLS